MENLSNIFWPLIDENTNDTLSFPDVLDLNGLPQRVLPFTYTGLGTNIPEIPETVPDYFKLKPTDQTMVIQPVRNLITGEIESFKDVPVPTSAGDTPGEKPITSYQVYSRGSTNSQSFLPKSFSVSKRDFGDFSQFLTPLRTGINLLTSPFDEDKETDSNEVVALPDIEDMNFEPSTLPSASTYSSASSKESCTASIDEWDVSLFDSEIPNPACTFPYELDPFQKRSIRRLERNESVFVSAPTSAGKTVVVQYSIALNRLHKMRTIYTAPIKALSNQKYRDFSRQFGDVGILTGDISLNRDASTLIMTTEVLRSMLYKSADLLRDVETVIFDECHYLNDEERGVVWEECIILMPTHINMVFLSATAPNDIEVSNWIGRTKQREIFVERHFVRPVPLTHGIYVRGKIHIISTPEVRFNESEYKKAIAKMPKSKDGKKPKNLLYNPSFWPEVVTSMQKKDLLPVLMFTFSQNNCQKYAENCQNLNLLTPEESRKVRGFCYRSIQRLTNPDDRKLPQVTRIFELLEKGIGVHHGGILPILKEIVEILLTDGLVKLLFCTSTFASGINVPARTCAFSSFRKFNGKEFENLKPSEYVQMCGRAGRRGLDTFGTALLILANEEPEEPYLRELMSNKGEVLESQFHLRFNMILNLARVQGISMGDLLARTLNADKQQSLLPKLKKNIEDKKSELYKKKPVQCVQKFPDIEDTLDVSQPFASIILELLNISREIYQIVGFPAFSPGTVFLVFNANQINLAMFNKETKSEKIEIFNENQKIEIIDKNNIIGFFKPIKLNKNSYTPGKMAEQLKSTTPLSFKLIFNSKLPEFVELANKHDRLIGDLVNHHCYTCASRFNHTKDSLAILDLRKAVTIMENQILNDKVSFEPILESYVSLLIDRGYMGLDRIIKLKGRISIEIATANELICTELLCNNFFENLEVEDIPPILSVMCAQRLGSHNENEDIPDHLIEKVESIYNLGEELFDQMEEHGIDVDESWKDDNINPAVMRPVYLWAQGYSFSYIMAHAQSVPEGSIVRLLNKTADLARNMESASKIMGTMDLAEKFKKAQEIIKRDIIFTASLYLD